MKPIALATLLIAVAALWAAPAPTATAEEVLRPAPAAPQPDAAALRPGLAVKYAYPGDIKSLTDAESWRSYDPKPGPPLVGFDYPDTLPDEKALTSDAEEFVVAFIDGYIAFEQPGTHYLEFWSNDGLRVELGGIQIYEHDGRHPCETLGPVAIEIETPGWYPVQALYFQRRNTSCLLMKSKSPDGELDWAPLENYAHQAE